MNLQIIKKLKNLNLYANYLKGITKTDYQSGVMNNLTNIRTSELQFAITHQDNNRVIGLSYYQPLKVDSGSIQFTLPDGKSIKSQNFNLAHDVYEQNVELFLDKKLSENNSLSINLIKSFNASGSDGDDEMLLIKYKSKF
jgi:hypothetical protein